MEIDAVLRPGAAERVSVPASVSTPPRRLMLRARILLAVILLDAAVVLGSVATACLLWLGTPVKWNIIPLYAALCPLYLIIAFNGEAFASDTLTSARRGVFRSLRALVFACTALVISAFFLKAGEQISRMIFFIGGMTAGCVLLTTRTILPFLIRRRYGPTLESEVLILDGADFEEPEGMPSGMFVIDAAEAGLTCDLRDPMMLDRLGRLLSNADRVVIACAPERRRAWAMMLKGANIRGEVLARELDRLGPLGTARFGDTPTVIVATGSLAFRQRVTKRALDMALCFVALTVTAPLLLLVAIAIKLDSEGPVLFVQQRVGRGNRLFNMYKFRSMRVDACDDRGSKSTARNDNRITRVGALIRATSVDELPQFINILSGDMSIVGPRPHALGSLAGDTLFWEVDERYWHRHACKPGLTGLAQVRGLRGATHQRTDLTNRLQADLEYTADWTIWKDIGILFATLRVVVHRNAY